MVGTVGLLALLLPACWNGSSLGRLFGAPGDGGGDGGFDPGIGGGLTLRDVFVNARLARAAPSIVTTAPEDGTQDVSLKSPIVIQFSESMFESSVRTGVSLFQSGSNTATAATVTAFQGDSVVVLVPQVDLLPNTDYELVIAGSVTDLQGDAIDSSGGADIRFRFTTIESTGDPDFDVIFSSPAQQSSEVPRGSEVVLVFSEPFDVATTGGGINAPGNVVVRRNGATLAVGTDYTLSTFPSANPRVVQIVFGATAPANAAIDVIVDSDVKSADGQESVNNGNGFDVSFTAQNTAIPEDVAFPTSPVVPGKDGAIGSVDLHAFQSDVDLTADGNAPETTTIIFFDAAQQNALLFNQTAADPTHFVSDLQPEATPALFDGDVIVAAYVERRGFRSEVSVLETLLKDTVGPHLITMGPPDINPSILVTQVNDPVLHGQMSEACAGIQVDFDGAGSPDFNSVQFAAGRSTVRNEFFVTGASEDAALPQRLEITPSFSFISSDILGNVSVNADAIAHQTVGKVGAAVGSPDGASALYVAAFAADNFQQFVSGGAVLLDAFPPAVGGAGQIVKAVSAGSGVVRFTEAELGSIPTALVSVTIVAERAQPTGTVVIFGPVTFAGLAKPTAASPRAILVLLTPEPTIDLTSNVQCDIVNESNNSPVERGSAFAADVLPGTPELERFAPMQPNPGLADNVLDLPLSRLHCFSVIEQFNFGGTQLRFISSEPFTAEADPGGGFGLPKQRTVDFAGRPTYSDGSHPHLVHSVSFDDAAVSSGGAVGLLGSEAPGEQLRELRVIARIPGFVDQAGVGTTFSMTPSGGTRTAVTLLPQAFLDNDTAATTGFEDSPLELLLQPSLIDPAAAVDPVPLRRNLRLELIIQDQRVAGTTTPSSGYTRERFLFDATTATAHAATPQPVPDFTLDDPTHPPQISWPEVTQGEGMHCLSLVSAIKTQTWRIYVPAQAGGGTITMRVPNLPVSLPDGVGPVDFQIPGTYATFVESFDFDPDQLFGPGSPEQYHFDPQSWFQTDLEREFLRASRSDPNRTITTN